MNYPSTYLLMKASVCHFMACKHDGECDKCEYGPIRAQAARDHDAIFGQRLNQLMLILGNVYNDPSFAELRDGVKMQVQNALIDRDKKQHMSEEQEKMLDAVMSDYNLLDERAMTELANGADHFEISVGPWTIRLDTQGSPGQRQHIKIGE